MRIKISAKAGVLGEVDRLVADFIQLRRWNISMNIKIIMLGLAMVAVGLIGCTSRHNPKPVPLIKNGVTLHISIPSSVFSTNNFPSYKTKSLSGFLMMSNGSPDPIRYTPMTFAECRIEMSKPAWFDFRFMPGNFVSDSPTYEQFAETVKTLSPGQVTSWPFYLFETEGGTNKVLHVAAEYDSTRTNNYFLRGLNLWCGHIAAEPVVIHLTN
ncbi:MAG TPA: hypothetical protein VGO57_13795 [Verrucomicrobiae bacterium]|jgi:hypothetical protein